LRPAVNEDRQRETHSMSVLIDLEAAPTTHPRLLAWVRETAELTEPDSVVWVDGSPEEWARVTDLLVEQGTFTRLNPALKPNSFLAVSDPADVARVEDRTYICSHEQRDAGVTNNWMPPEKMKTLMTDLYRGSMRGRTMYVIP
jgi:phosphoenolpyruvate carboxykinase (GTP)